MPVTAPGTGDGLRIVTEAELDAAARLIQAAASSYIDEALEATAPAVTTHCTLDVAGLVVQPDSSLVFAVRPSPFFYPHRLAEGDDTAEGDLACAGLCAPVDTGFGADIPICGDCETDADCAMGETCVAGMAGQGGLAGNSCQ